MSHLIAPFVPSQCFLTGGTATTVTIVVHVHSLPGCAAAPQGKPSTDGAGEALSKAAAKNADKLLQKQGKEHTKFNENLKKTPDLLANLKVRPSHA